MLFKNKSLLYLISVIFAYQAFGTRDRSDSEESWVSCVSHVSQALGTTDVPVVNALFPNAVSHSGPRRAFVAGQGMLEKSQHNQVFTCIKPFRRRRTPLSVYIDELIEAARAKEIQEYKKRQAEAKSPEFAWCMLILNTYGVAAGKNNIVKPKKAVIPTRVVYIGNIKCIIQGTDQEPLP